MVCTRHVLAIGVCLGIGLATPEARAASREPESAAPPAAAASADWLPQVQQALAAREYEASSSGAGLQAPNRKHDLRTYFDPTGIRVHARSAAGSPALLALRLAGLGRGAALAPVAPGVVASEGARVEIRRPGVVEWFVNSEAGLEQGFTLAERPAGEGPLVLELALAQARATLAGERVLLATGTGRKLAYGGLVAIDARGAAVLARFEVPSPERLRLVVDDADAVYPLTIDPLLTASADTQLESDQANATFGGRAVSAGDVNGDGYADVIVGSLYYDAGQSDEGAAFIFHGSASGIASSGVGSAATQLESNQTIALFGASVASAGDVNGDGYSDVIVGAHMYDAGTADEGAAFVFLGSATGVASGNPSTAAAQLESNQGGSLFGRRVSSAGDVNGDGYADVIVGADEYAAGQAREGAAFIFLGSAAGVVNGNPATAATQLESNQIDAFLGASVASAGDVNGDGYADVIVGAADYTAGQTDEGAAFVFLGSGAGIASGNPSTSAAQLESNQANSRFGAGAASAGDVNGDGYSDVIVGAPMYDAGQTDEGAAFVFLGSAAGIAGGNPATAATLLQSDQADAQFGSGVASAGDVNGDGYADVIVGASVFDVSAADEGAAFVFVGGSTGIASGNPATAWVQLAQAQTNARFGSRVASAGDVNGDGYSDVIVGASAFDAGEAVEGAAFVYLGGAQGIVNGDQGTASAQLEADQAFAELGWSVAGAGDVNRDGFSDVIVGAHRYDAGQADEGAAFVFLGGPLGIVDANPGTAAAQLESDQASAEFGTSVAGAGDVNGDGYTDVIIGAPRYDAGESDEGAAFVFLGSLSGIVSAGAASAAAQLESNQVNADLGRSVASAGDVNGDGFADVVVGGPAYDAGQSNEGAAFVFLGSPSAIADGSPGTAAAQLESDQADAFLGMSVASAGDVNGDGYADLIVGSPTYDSGQSDEGAVFVFPGGASGIADGSPATAAAQLESNLAVAFFGHSVAAAGDVNGDGYADVIVGAPAYDAGETDEGAAFVFPGGASGIVDGNPATATAQLESDQALANLGISVAGAGDVNGDGYTDVIVGANGYDAGQADEGAAFVFLGGASGIADGDAGTAAARLESNQVSALLGQSVASAGDVNGDGYADVIVGVRMYDAGQTDEGAAFVFLGGGNQTGRPVFARQLRGGGSPIAVQPWGAAYDTDDFQVLAFAVDPHGRGRVKLQVQVCPVAVAFGHASCTTSTSPSWTSVGIPPGGTVLNHSVSGLADDTLYRWRARVLYAPYSVTQPGITAPPNPAHGPWRRLFGQAVEADLRIRLDTDGDGISNGSDLDDDGDFLLDTVETDTGTYVSPSNTGTDPLDADSDDDGMNDGVEVPFGTNPNDPDHDDDTILDGPDNCPFISNAAQTNTDSLPAGNACQCGDVNNDGIVTATDAVRAGEKLVGRTLGGTFVAARCNVTGSSDGGITDCDVADLAVLERFTSGQPSGLKSWVCEAYGSP